MFLNVSFCLSLERFIVLSFYRYTKNDRSLKRASHIQDRGIMFDSRLLFRDRIEVLFCALLKLCGLLLHINYRYYSSILLCLRNGQFCNGLLHEMTQTQILEREKEALKTFLCAGIFPSLYLKYRRNKRTSYRNAYLEYVRTIIAII